MADQTATYAVKLEDQISGPAHQGAASLQDLKAKIDADTSALRGMQASMRALQGGSNVSIAQFKELRDRITAQKEAIASATTNYVKLGGTFERIAKPALQSQVSLDKVQAAAGHLNGPLGALAGTVKDTSELIGQGGLAAAAGLAAVAVVVLAAAVAAAAAGALVALVAKALQAGDALRDLSVDLQGAAIAAKNFRASGEDMAAAVVDVARGVPIASDKVADFARQLAGIKGDAFKDALQAVATIGSVGGDTGKVVAQLKAAAAAGQDISRITRKIQDQYGDLARAKMLDVNVQFAKAKENITGLFAGVKIEPLEKALQSVLHIFDSTTVTGKALKTIIESLLNPLIGDAAKAGPVIVGLFKQGIIWALKLAVGIYLARNKIAEFFGIKKSDVLVDALKLIGATALVMATAIGIATAVVLGIVAIFAVAAAAPIALAVAIGVAGKKVVGYAKKFVSAGAAMISGLVSGIKAGATKVISAISGVVKGGISAAKKLLGIASPSKVFAQIGVHTSHGMAEGIDQGSGRVEASAKDMLSIPAGRAGASGAGGGGARVAIGSVSITIDGAGKSAGDILAELEGKLEDLFERAAGNMGAPLEAAS